MPNSPIRLLGPEDGAALTAFLHRHAESSLFLLSNLRRAGIIDQGRPYQAAYAGLVSPDGEIRAVAAHCWNGILLLQAPVETAAVVQAALRPDRPIAGLIGPWTQVLTVRGMPQVAARQAMKNAREPLFSLPLDRLRVPESLSSGRWSCRRAESPDIPTVQEWNVTYMQEAMGLTDADAARADAARLIEEGVTWLLLDGGEPVARCTINAEIDGITQIGGVFTPPALRGRGYARAVVAGALVAARQRGIGRAVLFTDEGNHAAIRAYAALGFEPIGDYAILMFAP